VNIIFQVEQYLCENGVELRDYEAVFEDVEALASEKTSALKKASKELSEKNGHANGSGNDQTTAATEPKPAEGLENLSNTSEGSLDEGQGAFTWIDPGTCSYAVYSRLTADRVVLQQSPLALAKALKVDLWLILN
jgi:Xaa-Pro aminopeptidase